MWLNGALCGDTFRALERFWKTSSAVGKYGKVCVFDIDSYFLHCSCIVHTSSRVVIRSCIPEGSPLLTLAHHKQVYISCNLKPSSPCLSTELHVPWWYVSCIVIELMMTGWARQRRCASTYLFCPDMLPATYTYVVTPIPFVIEYWGDCDLLSHITYIPPSLSRRSWITVVE